MFPSAYAAALSAARLSVFCEAHQPHASTAASVAPVQTISASIIPLQLLRPVASLRSDVTSDIMLSSSFHSLSVRPALVFHYVSCPAPLSLFIIYHIVSGRHVGRSRLRVMLGNLLPLSALKTSFGLVFFAPIVFLLASVC